MLLNLLRAMLTALKQTMTARREIWQRERKQMRQCADRSRDDDIECRQRQSGRSRRFAEPERKTFDMLQGYAAANLPDSG